MGKVLVLAAASAVVVSVSGAEIAFTEVAGSRDIGPYDVAPGHGGGIAAADYDGDGDIDLFVPNGDTFADQLYRNLGDGGGVDEGGSPSPSWSGLGTADTADLVRIERPDGTVKELTDVAGNQVITEYDQEPGLGPAYVDVTAKAGLSPYINIILQPFPENQGVPLLRYMQRNMGNGGAVGDYDGDGDLDIYMCRWEGVPNALLRNDLDLGMKKFTDVTAAAGVQNLGLSRVAHFVDLDNDGDLDLVVLNDNDAAETHVKSAIYSNNGDGTFTDVTAGSGFDPWGHLRCGMSFADYDNDGLLDIYTTVWTLAIVFELGDPKPTFPGANRLFRNLGNFQFVDVTEAVGLELVTLDSFTGIFHDFNNDNRPDLYQAIDHLPDEFYWNFPGGFIQISDLVGITHRGNDMGAACADFDDDGDLDIYTTNITGPPFGTDQGNCFYINLLSQGGSTFFLDQSFAYGVNDTYFGWGVEWIDVQNDGHLDLLAVSGFDEWVVAQVGKDHRLYQTPPVLFVNDGTPAFTRVYAPGLEHGDDSRGLVNFDYDRDGDGDLLIFNTHQPLRLLENVTNPRGHWLDVKVVQKPGLNRNGIGVTVRAVMPDAVVKRREIIAGESYVVGTPAEVHFGLGDVTVVPEIRVEWTDGTETVLTDVAADQLLVVEQQGPVYGDLDGDGDVDFADLVALLGLWGQCPPPPDPCPGDLNGDGVVNFTDLVELLSAWT